jgi:hypothetical protein
LEYVPGSSPDNRNKNSIINQAKAFFKRTPPSLQENSLKFEKSKMNESVEINPSSEIQFESEDDYIDQRVIKIL